MVGAKANSLEMKLIPWHRVFARNHTTKFMQLGFQSNDLPRCRVGARCFKVHEEPRTLSHIEELRHGGPRMVWTCARLEVHWARNTNSQWPL